MAEDIIALFGNSQIEIIVILIMIDVVLGIVAALVKKDFCLGKLAKFMQGPVLAYVLGFAVIRLIGQSLPRLSLLVPVVFVLIALALFGSILRNLARFGLRLPKFLKK